MDGEGTLGAHSAYRLGRTLADHTSRGIAKADPRYSGKQVWMQNAHGARWGRRYSVTRHIDGRPLNEER